MDIRSALTFYATPSTRTTSTASCHSLQMTQSLKCLGGASRGGRVSKASQCAAALALASKAAGCPLRRRRAFCGLGPNTGMSKWTPHRHARDGNREVHGCDFYAFRDGKVIRKDSYWKIVE